MPGLAALAIIFLTGAGATGLDQMANVKPRNPITSAVLPSGWPSLDHLILRGLAKG